jgi:tetratricopeptide (TPR) repeat protein
MEFSAKKLAAGAFRVAAMAQLGPLAGGLFVAGGAVIANVLAPEGVAKTIAEMGAHLGSHAASELFGSALEGFRSGRNGDIEKSMQSAAMQALLRLKREAPDGFADWFDDWHSFLRLRPAAEVFAGAPDLDPVAVTYEDDQFRDFWWTRMEPILAQWRITERSQLTALNLAAPRELPAPLAEFLKKHMPRALEEAHFEVLRDPGMQKSWIAFQQHVSGTMLHELAEIKSGVGQANQKLDVLLGRSPNSAAGPVWNIPLPTQHFHDRPELIGQIDAALQQGVAALTALHGLGGIGKTQLARRFAQQKHGQYKLGLWIEADTPMSLFTSLSKAAELLHIPAVQDQEAMAVGLLSEISSRDGWLVIFDNAESADAVRRYVELLSGNGHVLITSRSEQWDGLATPVSVTRWTVGESARFLLERTGQTDVESAEGLARDLDGLVLALEHAAAYMLAGDGMALAEYRRVWRERLRWTATGHAYHESVAAALGLSLDAVAAKSPAAYELMCLFAWLAPDRIPRKELLEAGAGALPEALSRAFADSDQWTELINLLGRYSLLGRERTEGVTTAYSVHRVVQEVVRDRLAENGDAMEWLRNACDLVSRAFPFDSDEPPFWPVSEALLPHARQVRDLVRGRELPASLGRLLSQASLYLQVRGHYAEGRDFLELALESDLLHLGPDRPEVAVRRSNLAIVLSRLGEHGEARKQIELALESGLRQLGPDHSEVAVRRSNLAIVLRRLGEHGEARKQIELALESDLRQLGPDHPNVAVRRSNLATILRDLGEHGEARKQIELALESDLQQLGPDHPNVAVRRSNLADILGALGEHGEARKQIELALESDLQQFGPDHPKVAVRRSNLAAVLYRTGDRENALGEIDAALQVFRRRLPAGHPHIRGAEANRQVIFDMAAGKAVGQSE